MRGDPAERLPWIDTARAFGMVLVFYGHFAERLVDVGAAAVLPQFKLVYAFHMPFFFVLAGYLARPAVPGFARFLRERATARLVPVVFFNALGLGISLGIDSAFGGGPDAGLYGELLRRLALGYPSFDFMTWFLICLFVVEILHRAVGRFPTSTAALAGSAAAFLAGGLFVTANLAAVVRATGIPPNFWYVHEALVATGFYQLGIVLRRRGALEAPRSHRRQLALAAVAGGLVLATFGENHGPFVFKPVVLMALSSHGEPALFVFTAVSGTLFLVFAAQATPPTRATSFVGSQTVVFLGINGLLFNFANGPLAFWLAPKTPDTPVATSALCAAVTLATLAASVPLAAALVRWLPQLVGRPRLSGPLLPRLA